MKRKIVLFILFLIIIIIAVYVYLINIKKDTETTGTIESSITESNTQETTTKIANPASTNCIDKGGTLIIKTKPGGQYGVCFFEDGRACNEWALFRGECPVGGVKTTGYYTDAQINCAWAGGKMLDENQTICTFQDGSTCPTEDYYNGTCS